MIGAALLHNIHLSDAQTVGGFLGGQNFTICEALMSGATPSSAVATGSGAVNGLEVGEWNGVGTVSLAVMGAAGGAALL
jgi:hypothetical protein